MFELHQKIYPKELVIGWFNRNISKLDYNFKKLKLKKGILLEI